MYELDASNMLNAKMDDVVKMLNRQGEIGSSSNISVACCTLCGGTQNGTNYINFEHVQ